MGSQPKIVAPIVESIVIKMIHFKVRVRTNLTDQTCYPDAVATAEIGGDALPVCLWQENSNRLVSLRDLLVKYAHFFFVAGDMLRASISALASMADQIDEGRRDDQFFGEMEEQYNKAGATVKCLKTMCESMPLPVSKKAIERAMNNTNIPFQAGSVWIFSLAHELDSLSKTISDELDSLEFMPVDPVRKRYFFAEADLFGAEVADRFSASTVDIVEAGRCYALRRNTACVFHCMRVLEAGLHVLAKAIGFNTPRLDWEPVIARLDKLLRMDASHLKQIPSDHLPEVHDNRDYYAGVSAYFNAVKIAWRNRTMHIGIEYNGEHALLILSATEGFMKHLALRLSEPPRVV